MAAERQASTHPFKQGQQHFVFHLDMEISERSKYKYASVSSKPAGIPADNAGRCLTDLPHPLINMQMTLIDMQITYLICK